MLGPLTVIRGKFALNFLLIIILIFASNFKLPNLPTSFITDSKITLRLSLPNESKYNFLPCILCFLGNQKIRTQLLHSEKKFFNFDHCYTIE